MHRHAKQKVPVKTKKPTIKRKQRQWVRYQETEWQRLGCVPLKRVGPNPQNNGGVPQPRPLPGSGSTFAQGQSVAYHQVPTRGLREINLSTVGPVAGPSRQEGPLPPPALLPPVANGGSTWHIQTTPVPTKRKRVLVRLELGGHDENLISDLDNDDSHFDRDLDLSTPTKLHNNKMARGFDTTENTQSGTNDEAGGDHFACFQEAAHEGRQSHQRSFVTVEEARAETFFAFVVRPSNSTLTNSVSRGRQNNNKNNNKEHFEYLLLVRADVGKRHEQVSSGRVSLGKTSWGQRRSFDETTDALGTGRGSGGHGTVIIDARALRRSLSDLTQSNMMSQTVGMTMEVGTEFKKIDITVPAKFVPLNRLPDLKPTEDGSRPDKEVCDTLEVMVNPERNLNQNRPPLLTSGHFVLQSNAYAMQLDMSAASKTAANGKEAKINNPGKLGILGGQIVAISSVVENGVELFVDPNRMGSKQSGELSSDTKQKKNKNQTEVRLAHPALSMSVSGRDTSVDAFALDYLARAHGIEEDVSSQSSTPIRHHHHHNNNKALYQRQLTGSPQNTIAPMIDMNYTCTMQLIGPVLSPVALLLRSDHKLQHGGSVGGDYDGLFGNERTATPSGNRFSGIDDFDYNVAGFDHFQSDEASSWQQRAGKSMGTNGGQGESQSQGAWFDLDVVESKPNHLGRNSKFMTTGDQATINTGSTNNRELVGRGADTTIPNNSINHHDDNHKIDIDIDDQILSQGRDGASTKASAIHPKWAQIGADDPTGMGDDMGHDGHDDDAGDDYYSCEAQVPRAEEVAHELLFVTMSTIKAAHLRGYVTKWGKKADKELKKKGRGNKKEPKEVLDKFREALEQDHMILEDDDEQTIAYLDAMGYNVGATAELIQRCLADAIAIYNSDNFGPAGPNNDWGSGDSGANVQSDDAQGPGVDINIDNIDIDKVVPSPRRDHDSGSQSMLIEVYDSDTEQTQTESNGIVDDDDESETGSELNNSQKATSQYGADSTAAQRSLLTKLRRAGGNNANVFEGSEETHGDGDRDLVMMNDDDNDDVVVAVAQNPAKDYNRVKQIGYSQDLITSLLYRGPQHGRRAFVNSTKKADLGEPLVPQTRTLQHQMEETKGGYYDQCSEALADGGWSSLKAGGDIDDRDSLQTITASETTMIGYSEKKGVRRMGDDSEDEPDAQAIKLKQKNQQKNKMLVARDNSESNEGKMRIIKRGDTFSSEDDDDVGPNQKAQTSTAKRPSTESIKKTSTKLTTEKDKSVNFMGETDSGSATNFDSPTDDDHKSPILTTKTPSAATVKSLSKLTMQRRAKPPSFLATSDSSTDHDEKSLSPGNGEKNAVVQMGSLFAMVEHNAGDLSDNNTHGPMNSRGGGRGSGKVVLGENAIVATDNNGTSGTDDNNDGATTMVDIDGSAGASRTLTETPTLEAMIAVCQWPGNMQHDVNRIQREIGQFKSGTHPKSKGRGMCWANAAQCAVRAHRKRVQGRVQYERDLGEGKNRKGTGNRPLPPEDRPGHIIKADQWASVIKDLDELLKWLKKRGTSFQGHRDGDGVVNIINDNDNGRNDGTSSGHTDSGDETGSDIE